MVCVESGSADNPSVILIHGFPSQAYSYSKVLPILSKDYHAIAFDWLGKNQDHKFGFSDKPQPKYGFDYTTNEFVASLESFINEVSIDKVTLVVQRYFAPVVVKYASSHQEKIDNIILLNAPVGSQSRLLDLGLDHLKNTLTIPEEHPDKKGIDDIKGLLEVAFAEGSGSCHYMIPDIFSGSYEQSLLI
ncbi:hypothetical protein ACFX2F_035365 [Malus domestica]